METNGPQPLLHPGTRIGVWVLYAVAVAAARWELLAGAGGLVVVWLALSRPAGLRRMLRRARWLLVSLVLVYAFATPGVTLSLWEGGPGPSREGLALGLLQAARILCMIGGLALLLAATPAEELIAGLWALLRPLAPLGLDAQRLALRLALTLEYAQHAAVPRVRDWRVALAAALEPEAAPPAPVRMAQISFTWRDAAAAGAGTLILLLGLA